MQKPSPPVHQITIESFQKSFQQELVRKIQKSEELNKHCFIESTATGVRIEASVQNKILCKRCEQFFLPSEMVSHQDAHSSQIRSWLYLGGQRNSENLKELIVRTEIKCILNLAAECKNLFPDRFEYKKYDLYDDPKQLIYPYFDECFKFLDNCKQQNKNVLVHCIQGISRSASVLIAFLMQSEKISLKEAIDSVKSCRSIVRPNPGFFEQLIQYELQLFGANSVDMGYLN